jgi:hypothetical protein
MTERILIPFSCASSGTAELTWGQWELWPAMQLECSSFPIGGYLPVAPGRTVADIAGDLKFLVERHASLRTRMEAGADGGQRQVLAAHGEVPLLVTDAGTEDPEQVAAALQRRWEGEVFDYPREFPVRWGVVTSQGTARYLVSVICHLAADGAGVMVLLDDLAGRDQATGAAAGPPAALTALELTGMQRGPASKRQNDAALRYWEDTLRKVPAARFPPVTPQRPRYWQALYNSPAAYLAAQAVAARTGYDTSMVLLAAHAVNLVQVSGVHPAVVQAVTNNRFRRGFAGLVSPLCSFALCVLDVGGCTFDEAVGRAWRAALRAYKLAYCDPLQREAVIARVTKERGAGEIDIRCFLNDRRLNNRQEPGAEVPGPDQIRAALPRTTLTWGFRHELPNERCYLNIDNVPDTVHCELRADTAYVPPSDMEALLRGLEAVLVQAALNPAF